MNHILVAPRPPDREWVNLPAPEQPRPSSRGTINIVEGVCKVVYL